MENRNATTSRHIVSAIVPVCNVERYLEQCLSSIRSKLGPKLQVIIVDDGSTDSSPEIARAFVERLGTAGDPMAPDLSILTKENGGYGSAVNLGIEHADGLYIGIVEPDDYLDGDLFGELAAIAEATGHPDIVKSTYKRVWMPDTPEQRIWSSLLRHRGVRTWSAGTTDLGESPQLVRWHPSVWSAIYRRDFLDAKRIRFIEYPGGGWVDNPFVMRAMCQAERIAYTDDAWYCYREDRPGSSTVTKAADLSLIRWHEMADEVEASRFAENEGVLRSLYSIAFRYLGNLWDTESFERPDIRELALKMAGRMRPDIVLPMEDIAPAAKRRLMELRIEAGTESQTDAEALIGRIDGSASYRRFMLGELLYSWRENGLFFACERAGLHRRRS